MAGKRLHYATFRPREYRRAPEVVTITPDAHCPDCGAPLYIGREPHICRQGYTR